MSSPSEPTPSVSSLLDVVPVWLLSPETMAILFPRQQLFDVVVFDEASQCTVEAGLPVLVRAKRVAIAGDEKQMPPSSYFALGNDPDDEPAAASQDADETKEMVRDLLTAESLLSLARPRVAHTGLAWHYRCRDESLIAFSNHAMYEGGLLTIPSTTRASGPPRAASGVTWMAAGTLPDAPDIRPSVTIATRWPRSWSTPSAGVSLCSSGMPLAAGPW